MCFAEGFQTTGFNPYDHPVYKHGETRWGNGVLFYPGSRLTMIGTLENIKGPVPSMRLKAWRNGLQLVEYCRLADTLGHKDRSEPPAEKPDSFGVQRGRSRNRHRIMAEKPVSILPFEAKTDLAHRVANISG